MNYINNTTKLLLGSNISLQSCCKSNRFMCLFHIRNVFNIELYLYYVTGKERIIINFYIDGLSVL